MAFHLGELFWGILVQIRHFFKQSTREICFTWAILAILNMMGGTSVSFLSQQRSHAVKKKKKKKLCRYCYYPFLIMKKQLLAKHITTRKLAQECYHIY